MQYYILAASKNAAHLYEVTDTSIKEHPVEGMPKSMSDAWKGTEREENAVSAHGSAGAGIFHGQGAAKDVMEQEEDGYYHQLAQSLGTFLHNQPHPLIFAGVEEAFGMLRKFDKSHRLLDEYVRGNPDQFSKEELKEKADPIAKKFVLAQNDRLLEEYGNLLGTGRTSDDPEAILQSAQNGKVDVLLIAEGKQAGGPSPISEVVTHTLAHRGRVALIASGHMPDGKAVVAILRL